MRIQSQRTRDKLDALHRKEWFRRAALWIVIPIFFALTALFVFRPSKYVGDVQGIVERSVVSIDAYGGKHHELYVKLDDNRTVLVYAMSMQPLKKGQQITLSQRTRSTGQTFYQLDLGRPAKPNQRN